jgi:hypothetical protein
MKPEVGKTYLVRANKMSTKEGEQVRITNLYSDTNLPNGAGRFTLPTWDGYVDVKNPKDRHIRAGRDEDIEALA